MRYTTFRNIPTASPESAWQALIRVTEWPRWTESIKRVEVLDGALHAGARVRIHQPRLRTSVYTVERWEPGVAFTWSAEPSGMRVEATHELITGGDALRMRLQIDLSGGAAALVWLLLGRRMRHYVDLEADGLCRFAEHIDSAAFA
jgi:hypothetical protein